LNKSDRTQRYLDGAVLNPHTAAAAFDLKRYLPCAELRPFIRHFWFVRWNLPEGTEHVQVTLPLPAVNVVLEVAASAPHASPVRAVLFGPQSLRGEQRLTGCGAAFGTLFLPAGFQPFVGSSMHQLRDQTCSLESRFGPLDAAFEAMLHEQLRSTDIDADIQQVYEAYWLRHLPATSDHAVAAQWVELVEQDPSLGRAEVLAERVGVSLRTLERGFRHYVGLGPKPLIRRYRLLEAAGRLVQGEDIAQAKLAHDLGYADQAHFVRDFRSVIGHSPGHYAAAQSPIKSARRR
jgi:AraC-like DNA-binding protein